MITRQLHDSSIILTGADGMLGRGFKEIISKFYPNVRLYALSKTALDVTKRDKVLELSKLRPTLIIHCAALSNVDQCELEPDRCYQVQVEGAKNIVELASIADSKVFYPQTFLIFSKTNGLVDELTPPSPLSVYGKSKLTAEEVIRSSGIKSLVIRMGGMYGGDEKDKNFVGKFTRHVLELLKSGVDSYSVGNRVWQPTYTNDLARNSLLLLDHNKEGIWTMACEGEASFFDLANRCISLLGLNDKIEIKRANDHEILHKDIAMRPERICLNNKKLIDSNLSLMRPWEDALKEYLSRPWFDSLYQHCRASHIEPKGVQSG